MIELVPHAEAQELVSLSGSVLERRESENNLPLGLAYTLAENPQHFGPEPPLLLSVLDAGRSVGVAVMTPPKRIILSRFEADQVLCTVRIAEYLRSNDMTTPGVVGPTEEARAFVNAWSADVPGITSNVWMNMRVFEIREVSEVPIAPGSLRTASMTDLDLMVEWVRSFSDAIGESIDLEQAKKNTLKYLRDQQLYIWEDDEPVSLAARSRATRHGTTINKVYTPPEFRSRGYATSCVHELTRRLLSGGFSFCSLYTDLANPTSNSIYTKIGYRPVGDALAIDFEVPRDPNDGTG